MYCKYCDQDMEARLTLRPDTPHFGEYRCGACDQHLSWKSKEKNENKRTKNKYTPDQLDIFYCEMCLREKDELGLNETLTIHHPIEIQNGGQDSKENIWVVCIACHRMIHYLRTYLNSYLKKLKFVEENPDI